MYLFSHTCDLFIHPLLKRGKKEGKNTAVIYSSLELKIEVDFFLKSLNNIRTWISMIKSKGDDEKAL